MGVLTCSRRSCSNIMCDTYVLGVGYVCRECQDGFKRFIMAKNLTSITDEILREELEFYIERDEIYADSFRSIESEIDDYFNRNTKTY